MRCQWGRDLPRHCSIFRPSGQKMPTKCDAQCENFLPDAASIDSSRPTACRQWQRQPQEAGQCQCSRAGLHRSILRPTASAVATTRARTDASMRHPSSFNRHQCRKRGTMRPAQHSIRTRAGERPWPRAFQANTSNSGKSSSSTRRAMCPERSCPRWNITTQPRLGAVHGPDRHYRGLRKCIQSPDMLWHGKAFCLGKLCGRNTAANAVDDVDHDGNGNHWHDPESPIRQAGRQPHP